MITFLVKGTEGLKNEYAKYYHIPLEYIMVVPNWIDVEKIKNQSSSWRTKIIINEVTVPNFTSAIETIASLFGTTPLMLNACSNMLEKLPKDPTITLDPAPKIKNPILKAITISHEVLLLWEGHCCISRLFSWNLSHRNAASLSTSVLTKARINSNITEKAINKYPIVFEL